MHAVLVRCRLNRLWHVDRRTGEPIRRYEHDQPGAMLHVDVKKLGNIPDGGGWRYVGRDSRETGTGRHAGQLAAGNDTPPIGTAFVHTVIDDHSRVAYAEIHDDETAVTAVGVLRRAVGLVRRPRRQRRARALRQRLRLPQSHAWRDACDELGITPKRTRPYRPTDQREDRTLPPVSPE